MKANYFAKFLAALSHPCYNSSMEYFRTCPKCGGQIAHKSERSRNESQRTNFQCQSCGAKERIKKHGNNEQFIKLSTKGNNKGEDNPFYGKTHTEETKEKIRQRDKSFFATKEYKHKMSKLASGENNPMYGKTVMSIWVNKYGKTKANELMEQFKKKQSINSSGGNNPMFGKPAPQGSGNGWSGWYKGWFFRSLKELSYVVNTLEVNEDDWQSAESANIKIPYLDWKGTQRTYIPDFIVNSILLVEVKPTKLKSSISVRAKQVAAELFSKKQGWTYVIVDPPSITNEQIQMLHSTQQLKFTNRYEKLYLERQKAIVYTSR